MTIWRRLVVPCVTYTMPQPSQCATSYRQLQQTPQWRHSLPVNQFQQDGHPYSSIQPGIWDIALLCNFIDLKSKEIYHQQLFLQAMISSFRSNAFIFISLLISQYISMFGCTSGCFSFLSGNDVSILLYIYCMLLLLCWGMIWLDMVDIGCKWAYYQCNEHSRTINFVANIDANGVTHSCLRPGQFIFHQTMHGASKSFPLSRAPSDDWKCR